jgi:hypothetical protein
MSPFLPEIPIVVDPVGQIVSAKTTDNGVYGFIVAVADERRVFWHSDDCQKEPPEVGDLVSFRLAPPRKPKEAGRAKDIRIVAKAEKEA